jgi:predicted component of type VI protein secretion system
MAYQSVQLVMRAGPTPGKTYPIEKSEIFVGRDVANEVLINDAEVSRRHARISIQAGNYVIEDLGSTNGTFVNGQRLAGPRVLRVGDTVMFGENVSLTFEMAGYDPNATLIGTPGTVVAPQPSAPAPQPATPPPPVYTPPPPPPVQPAQPVYQPPPQPVYQPAPQPAYSGHIPASPVEPVVQEAVKPRRRTGLWITCGCLIVVLCVVVAAAVAFDQLDLYCVNPFRDVTVMFGGVCP